MRAKDLIESLQSIKEYKTEYEQKWSKKAKFAPGEKVVLHPFVYSGQDPNKEMPKRLSGKEHEHATVIAKSKALEQEGRGGQAGKSGFTTRYHIKYEDGTEAKIHAQHLLPAKMGAKIKDAFDKGYEYSHRGDDGAVHFKHKTPNHKVDFEK
jgi:hypothetical protein